MFDIKRREDGCILLIGVLDISHVDRARRVFNSINYSCAVDLKELEFISSTGLGVLLSAQKRLNESGHKLKLIHLNKRIKDIFEIAGFDFIFDIE